MKAHFKRVGLLGKSEDRNVSMTLRALAGFLEQQKVNILLDEGIANIFPETGKPSQTSATWPSWWVVMAPC